MKEKLYLKKFLFVLLLFLLGIMKVNAAKNPYKPMSRFGPNCTYHAWDEVYKRLGIVLPGWGNANTWYDYAKKAGFEVGSTPRNNSIAVWNWDKYGHVAFVEKVKGNTIYIWEAGKGCIDYDDEELKECIANGVSAETDEACVEKYGKEIGCPRDATYRETPGDLIGYIYLDHAPSKPVSSASKYTAPKKSNNANLSSLKISNIEFDFKKDELEYNLAVNNSIDSITIEAVAEHSKAKIEGNGKHPLELGDNTIALVVTAEDNTKKTYTIKIRRKENNANLNSLTISNIDFEFKKDTLDYDFQISRGIESVMVEATLESNLATITGLGKYYLNEEETMIKLIVTAEDETQKTYTLNIKKEPIVEENTKNSKMVWIIGIGAIVFCIAVSSIVIFLIKKKMVKKEKKS